MCLVENADRQQEQAGSREGGIAHGVLDIGLLEFDFARSAVPGQRVLELELGEEANAVCEFVAEEKHEPMEIDLGAVPGVRADLVVMQLAVTTNRGAAVTARVGRHQRFDDVASMPALASASSPRSASISACCCCTMAHISSSVGASCAAASEALSNNAPIQGADLRMFIVVVSPVQYG